MNTITTLLSLGVLTAGLAGCHGTPDGSTHGSAAGSYVSDDAIPAPG